MSDLIKIKTISAENVYKYKVKGSQFISRAFPIGTQKEAEEILRNIRKKFYDATHNTFAYSIYNEDDKYSDDGEPSGTAGKRIVNAINHFELSNLIVVVTRYFGGTKLGVGPLGKAYYDSAYFCLENASRIVKTEYTKIRIFFGFDQASLVHQTLNSRNAKKITNRYSPDPVIECLLKSGADSDVREVLFEKSNGGIRVEISEEKLFL